MASEAFEAQGPEQLVTVINEPRAIREWVKSLPEDAVIALESTGGYGIALAEIAYRRGLKVYVLAPRQISSHRRSLARRAKNDRLDALLIRDFISANHDKLHPYEPWVEPWKTLRKTVRLRSRLANDRARIAQRMRAFGQSPKEIAAVTRSIKKFMLELDVRIKEALKQIPEAKAIISIKGIGLLTTGASIAILGQIPFKSADAYVAHMGLDLIVSDSGKRSSKRSISSWGDVTIRNLYYLAAQSVAHSKEWLPYAEQLRARGMKPTQVHCAIARRLARIVFAIYHSGQTYNPEKISQPPKLASTS
jgi:transposase